MNLGININGDCITYKYRVLGTSELRGDARIVQFKIERDMNKGFINVMMKSL